MASAGTYSETNGLGVYREVNRMGSHGNLCPTSALARERSIVVNSQIQHLARPPC